MSHFENEIVVARNIEDEMRESYLRYSLSVIISRALPDVRDGLKPSQRRILFAMRQLNLSPGGKHRKCAKICGDTSGDYHPHGEQVIYPTLVRLAQPWAMRYPLIDGQGNFGSIDGDMAAAMRYTEARLTSSSVELMEDLDKDTVEMLPNYDETKREPSVFPAKFPNLITNGSSGIAVGMATNIPPHNLNEVVDATLHLLEHPKATIDELMQYLPGPDFPTGGIICGYRGIKEAYHTGRGKVILRGRLTVEEGEDGRTRIAVDEIPYNISKARLIEQIADLIHNKTITGISDLRDESDRDGLRIAIELKKGEMPEVIINQLYKFSDLQVTFGCNMLALDKGLPRLMNVKQILAAWIDHRIDVIRRRTRFELNKAEARAHILEGYLKALSMLDRVVAIIRGSDNREDARTQLIEALDLTDKQVHAVLELRLYQLTALEQGKLEEELNQLQIKIAHYREVLANEALVRQIIREELLELRKERKTAARRTQIIAAEGEMDMEDLIANDEMIITLSQDDYIKRMPVSTFREQRRGGQGVSGIAMRREDDVIKGMYVASAHDYLLIFTSLGRCYWLKVWQIPESGRKSKGKPLINLLEDLRPEEKIATVLRVPTFDDTESAIAMATRRGVIKKTQLQEFSNPRRKGIWALSIDEGDELVAARLVHRGEQIMLFTASGMAVRFDEANVRSMGRTARGVKGANLRDEKDSVVSCEVVRGDETVLIVCENGYGKRSNVDEFRQTNRGGVGVRSIITSERNGQVIGAVCVTDRDSIVMISTSGQTVRINMKDLRVLGRNTQGVRLVNLKEEDKLVAIQKLENSEENGEEQTESGEKSVSSIPEESIADLESEESDENDIDSEDAMLSHEEST